MKRTLVSIAFAAVPLGLGWLAGFDFDHRGFSAFYIAVCAIFVGVMCYVYPGWTSGRTDR